MAADRWGTLIFLSTDAYENKILIGNFSTKKEDIQPTGIDTNKQG